ncbi:MAG: serine dehydratase subunit alpha family protein [Solobacterium sp.]|nr:serine dehydratase subunit alpha family protein [Solobacterium sp.]
MDERLERNYTAVLKKELVPALGCTEPIALAYCAAKAREVLGKKPERVTVCCSGNVVKNVKAVTVPNSGGLKGIGPAVVLGIIGGRADKELEVLDEVTDEDIRETVELLKTDYFSCTIAEGVENLYIDTLVSAGEETARVRIVNRHTLITEIDKNDEPLYRLDAQEESEEADYDCLNMEGILEYAEEADLDNVKEILDEQIRCNAAISKAGIENSYGAEVGRSILKYYGNDVKSRARAYAAAGSDARMSGCSLPVVINSGSGNQGITVTMPLVEYAKELGSSQEKLYRALLVSNLTSVHLKHYIGSLSAFCGAVTAAAGAGAGIAYLHGADLETIGRTIVNTLANVGGIICDGAKPSCAAKIASAVDAAILGYVMAKDGFTFHEGEGIVQPSIEKTIRSVGYVGRVGMKITDSQILNIMLDKVDLENC